MVFRWSISFLLVLTVSFIACGGGSQPPSQIPSGSTSGGELLYLLSGNTIWTYSVDPKALTFSAIGSPIQLTPQPILQLVPSPNAHFLYALWADAHGAQQLSVLATNGSGLPLLPAVQTTPIPSLYQLNIHPNGSFAYMMQMTSSSGENWSSIRLFHLNSRAGSLSEDRRVLATYGSSANWPASLYGFSPDGSKLLISLQTPQGTLYRQRTIQLKTGLLESDVNLYHPGQHWGEPTIGRTVLVDIYRPPGSLRLGYLDVFPNIPSTNRPVIHCTFAMLGPCASATNSQLDPSERHLFLTDPATQLVHVVGIDTPTHQLLDTGNSIPFTAEVPGFSFSTDGTLVYAILASDNSLHVYQYNENSGALTPGSTPLPLPNPGSGFLPAQRH